MLIAIGIDVSDVQTTSESPAFTTGTLAHVATPLGTRIFQYVEANGALAVGDVGIIDETLKATAVTTTLSAPGQGQGLGCGVAVAALADAEFGWVQRYGFTEAVNVGTSAAQHSNLNTTGTGGRLDDDATAGSELVEGITTTGSESGNLAAGWLTWPYIGATL